MNTTQFIQDRNSKIKAEYQVLRTDKTKKREEHFSDLATKYNISTAIVFDAVYRSKKKGDKINT